MLGAVSWVFAERAGFGAFGRYLMRFARDNKKYANLLGNKKVREGLSTISGIIALGMVFGYIVVIASRDVTYTALLIGLAAMKTKLGTKAYCWPTADSLAFAYDKPRLSSQSESLADDEDDLSEDYEEQKSGFSSGERQLESLQEISENTNAAVYLLDEWDAKNRSQAESLVEKIAAKALVIEISHRNRV